MGTDRRVLAPHLVLRHARQGRTHDARKDLLESLGRTGRFRFPAVETVFELKERLADRVGERDAGRVDERDRADAPRLTGHG
jgi:hypothetical protein